MVDKIYEIKNRLLEEIEKQMGEKGPDRIDPDMVDMVKDLACAEKDCWEAEYYRSVTEAMEGGSGYSGGSSGGSSGWQNQYGSGRNSSGRRGYGDHHSYGSMGYQEAMNAMRHYMHDSNPVERERMRSEIRSMMDGAM